MVRYKDGTEATRRVTMHWDPAHCDGAASNDGCSVSGSIMRRIVRKKN